MDPIKARLRPRFGFLVALALLALSGVLLAGCGAKASVTTVTTVTVTAPAPTTTTSTTSGSTTATGPSTTTAANAGTVAETTTTVLNAGQPLRVSGNQLVIGAGQQVQLRGINRSGTEYKCQQGGGIFDSANPTVPDSNAMIAAMKRWDIDVVRVPLNEGCWLGLGDTPAAYSGATYRGAIRAYVNKLNAAGLFVILSLQWVSLNGAADYEPPMPDAQNGPGFWGSVAGEFKNNPDVLFDLYNEPFQVTWSCWLNGCSVPAGSGGGGGGASSWPAYTATGMQQLVDAVRGAGANQPLLIGGLQYALDFSQYLSHLPTDPDKDIVASAHSYGGRSPCDSSCQSALETVASQVPVVFGELGEVDCGTSYIDPMMSFADAHGMGYLGWTWDAVDAGWSCTGGPALIQDYDGAPTTYGAGFRDHFQSLGQAVLTSGSQ